jgi:hypothetical protein
VDVTHLEYAATMHGFLNFSGVLSAGDPAIEVIADDLSQAAKGLPSQIRVTAAGERA